MSYNVARSVLPGCIGAVALCGAVLPAQTPVTVRPIDSALASTVGRFGYLDRVRELSDGRVLVNDAMSRRLMAFAPRLDSFTVVVDSVRSGATSYGPLASALVPYVGDSSLLIDGTSLSMLVIDPRGGIARVAAAPDSRTLVAASGSSVAFDASVRMIFRSSASRAMRTPGGAGDLPLVQPDSAPLVAYDMATRRSDTLAMLRIPRSLRVTQQEGDAVRSRTVTEPFPLVDEAVVLSDGRIAIVRGLEYRVDWVVPGQGVVRGPRISFPWQRITDEEKAKLADSLAAVGRGSRPPLSAAGDSAPSPLEGLTANDMPDYRPAFRPGAVRADADGNLWVRTTITLVDRPGPVWDVIDGSGHPVRRILLPARRGIVGFGKNGIVYMASIEGELTRLEKARARIQ